MERAGRKLLMSGGLYCTQILSPQAGSMRVRTHEQVPVQNAPSEPIDKEDEMQGMTRTDRWTTSVSISMCIASALLVLSVCSPIDTHGAEKYQHLVNCDLHNGSCSQQLQ